MPNLALLHAPLYLLHQCRFHCSLGGAATAPVPRAQELRPYCSLRGAATAPVPVPLFQVYNNFEPIPARLFSSFEGVIGSLQNFGRVAAAVGIGSQPNTEGEV